MARNRWQNLADLEEEYGPGDESEIDRSGPGYTEEEVDEEWQKIEARFRHHAEIIRYRSQRN